MHKTVTLLSIFFSTLACAQSYKVFHTSVCYDMLSSFDKCEKIVNNTFFANKLTKDTVFIMDIETIKQKIRPSNICNLYSSLPTDKDDVVKCLDFFHSLKQEDIPERFNGEYVANIFTVMPQIKRVLQKLIDTGYAEYWTEQVYPVLKQAIDSYKFEAGLLDKIHTELEKMAGSDSLSEGYPKIYILDIDNAFSLNDETFCCTSVLLDKEIAKQYRINFIQVYIHENLHRLYLSKNLIAKLDELYEQDTFYRKNEDLARKHGEGKNEAFIVAAETYISRKLGLKTELDVYREFNEYVEGSLVLSPIVYQYLFDDGEKQSFNRFLLNLFESRKIKAGDVEKQYNEIMNKLKNNG